MHVINRNSFNSGNGGSAIAREGGSSLTVSAADFDAVRCGEEPGALLLSGEAVWHVAVELEGGGVEGRVEGVLAPGVAPVQRVAHEAPDALGHCNTD